MAQLWTDQNEQWIYYNIVKLWADQNEYWIIYFITLFQKYILLWIIIISIIVTEITLDYIEQYSS